ncbi:hypothetical protein QL285_070748 [Trifolium repens]|nr:hypothetical protein QL285_070748 [Trifolium repens]
MQTITSLNNASKAAARSLWIRTHSRHLECELLLDDKLVHLPDRSQVSWILSTTLNQKERFGKRRQAQRLAASSSLKIKEEPTTKAMGDEQRITMGDYCKRTDTDQISLGFQPANPANFDIKGNVLTGLRENQFDGRANNDPWDHLAKFSETCQIPKHESETLCEAYERLTLCEAYERFKLLMRRCPNHNIGAMEQMQLFTAGMKMQHRMILDASAGGSIKVKTYAETKDLVEQMCQNEYNMSHDRAEKTPGVLKVDQEIAYKEEGDLKIGARSGGLEFPTKLRFSGYGFDQVVNDAPL